MTPTVRAGHQVPSVGVLVAWGGLSEFQVQTLESGVIQQVPFPEKAPLLSQLRVIPGGLEDPTLAVPQQHLSSANQMLPPGTPNPCLSQKVEGTGAMATAAEQ